MKKTTRLFATLLGITTVAIGATGAHAGLKSTGSNITDTWGTIAGDLGAVRSNSTTGDYIGCRIETGWSNGDERVFCFAGDSIRKKAWSCYSYQPHVIAAVRSLNGDSRLEFYPSVPDGLCQVLKVSNTSDLRPKTL